MFQGLCRRTQRSRAISPEVQVLAALGFYTSGSFQTSMGDTIGISQASMSRCVSNVTRALVEKAPQFITFNRYDDVMPLDVRQEWQKKFETVTLWSQKLVFNSKEVKENLTWIIIMMFSKQRFIHRRAVLPGVSEGRRISWSPGGAGLCSGSLYDIV